MRRIPAVTETVVIEPAKIVFKIGQPVIIGEGMFLHVGTANEKMGGEYIPEKTIVKIVEPEKIVFEPGDRVYLRDLSYILKLDHMSASYIHTFDRPSLHIGNLVTIIATDLKIPSPNYSLIGLQKKFEQRVLFEKTHDGNIIYLDTLIKDTEGNYWLTQSRLLKG